MSERDFLVQLSLDSSTLPSVHADCPTVVQDRQPQLVLQEEAERARKNCTERRRGAPSKFAPEK